MEDASFLQERLPSEELAALAKKLGETYMTNDLATILPYKEFADARGQRQRRQDQSDDDAGNKQALETFRGSSVYLVKCNVLKTLASLAEEPQFKQYARNPMNLLFSELTQSYKDPLLRDDSHYRSLIFKILQQSADDVEIFYATQWADRSKAMIPAQAARFRKRLDLFVWRIHTRIISTLETKNFEELEINLAALADYIRNCYSRVMASQIVDVCMETMLTIKSYIFKRKIDSSTFRNAKIMHHLLAIFGEVALRNRFDPLNDLLSTFFLYKEDSYDFVKYYAYQVLGNVEFEKKVCEEYPNGKQLLREWRIQVIRHYRTCVIMIANHFRSDALAVDQLKMRLLKKMQFLVYPSGPIQRCLSEGSQYNNFQLKCEMLRFLHKLFSIKHCPFVRSKTYIDSYISLHYMQFIKLYNNYALDAQTLELGRRNLKILIDFAQQKNEEVRLKFYQLRAMDFLVREVNLEYEIKVKGRRYQELVARNDAHRKSTQIDPTPATRGPVVLPSGLTLRPIAALMQGELERREMVSALAGLDKSSSPTTSGPGSEASSYAPTPANSLGATSPLKSPSSDSVKDGPLYMSSLPGATVLPGSAFLDDISEEAELSPNSFPSPSLMVESEATSLYRGGRGRSNTLGSAPEYPISPARTGSVSSMGGQTSPSSGSASAVPKLNLNVLIAARHGKASERIFLPQMLDVKLKEADSNRQKRIGADSRVHGHSFPATGVSSPPSTLTVSSPVPVTSKSQEVQPTPAPAREPESTDSSPKTDDESESPKRTGSSSSTGRARAKSVDYSVLLNTKVSKTNVKRTTDSPGGSPKREKGSPRAGSLTRKTNSGTSNEGRNSPARKRAHMPTTEESAMESAYDTMDETIKHQVVAPSVIPLITDGAVLSKRSSLELKAKENATRRRSMEVSQPIGGQPGSPKAKEHKKRVSLSLTSSVTIVPASVPSLSPKAGRSSDAAADLTRVVETSTPSETPRDSEDATGNDAENEISESTDARSPSKKAFKPPVIKAVPKLSLSALGAMKGTPVSTDAKPLHAVATMASEPEPAAPKGSPKASPKSSPVKKKNTGIRLSVGPPADPPAPVEPEVKVAPAPKKGLPSLGMKIGALSLQKGELIGAAKEAAAPVTPAAPEAAPAAAVPPTASTPAPAAGPKKKLVVPPMAFGGLKLDKASMAAAAAGEPTATPTVLSPTTEDVNRPADRRMTLTALERGTSRAGKFQVLKKDAAAPADAANAPNTGRNNSKGAISSTGAAEGPNGGSDLRQVEERLYASERDNRKLYADDKLHEAILELIFFLLIAPNGFTLDSLYTHQYPISNVKMNVPFTMGLHLAHPMNKKVLGPLAKRTQRANESAFRLLRLLSMRFFQPSLYKDLERIAEGAYGTVYGAKLLGDDVAVKLMAVPRSIHDRCVLHDIFTEILVLDKWKADERICKMIDYGVDNEHYWIVMKRYKTSLRSWRVKQTAPLEEMLPLYLNIFSDVLSCVNFLAKNPANIGVNHYDIKCDNFLINPYDPNMSDKDLYSLKSDIPPFSVCLADFGESIVYTNERESYTIDNRGTEFIKSPEMLTIAYASNQERQTYDRRKKVGASTPSDIWSIGCLLYELLTGEFLFYDEDWVRFWLRVTTNTQDLISEKKKEAIHHNQPIINFLQWVLIRDAAYRPSYHDLIQRFSSLKQEVLDDLRRKKAGDSISPKSNGSLSDPLMSPLSDGIISPKPLTPKSPESARGKKTGDSDLEDMPSSGRTSARRAQMNRQLSEAITRPKVKKARPESMQIASLDIAEGASPRDGDIGHQSARSSSEARRRPAKIRAAGEGEKKRRSSLSVTIKEPSKGTEPDKTPRTPKSSRTDGSSSSPRAPDSARSEGSSPGAEIVSEQRRSSDSDIVRSSARESGNKSDTEEAERLALRQQVLAITGGAAPDAQPRPVSNLSSATSSAAESTDTEDDTPRTGSATPDSPHSPNETSKESGNTSGPEPQSPHLIRVGKKKLASSSSSTPAPPSKGNKSSRGTKGHQRAKTAGVPPLALGNGDSSETSDPAPASASHSHSHSNGASPRTPATGKAKIPPLALNLGGLARTGPAPEVTFDTSASARDPAATPTSLPSGKKPAIPRLSLQLGSSPVPGLPKPAIPVLAIAPKSDSPSVSTKEPAPNGGSLSNPRPSSEIISSSTASLALAGGPSSLSLAQQSVMVDKPKVLTQHDLPSLISMPHFDQGELNWYAHDPSQIYNHIWLGSYDSTADKTLLKHKFGITHIINCSNKPNLHPMHFRYEHLIVGDNADTPITSQVSKILIFVREAEKAKGRVLITEPSAPDTSIGAALAVALVMKLSPKKLSFYEAYRHVNAKRYISWMHPEYVQQLCEWNFARFVDLKKNYRQAYQCICANNSWTMLQPFDASAAANPLPCSCTWNVGSSCPNIDCQGFLNEMAHYHGFKATHVQWGYTSFENVVGDFEDTDEFNPSDSFSFQQREFIEEKEWKLFRCRRCNFITHAIRASNPNIVAVVANIPRKS